VKALKSHFDLVLGAALLAAGYAPLSFADEATSLVAPAQFAKMDGAGIYSHVCQGCHMPQGQGAKGAGAYPALAQDPNLASAPYIVLTVLEGRKNMPAFGLGSHGEDKRLVELTDAQVADVANYVRNHFGNHYGDSVSEKDVAALHK
jgi:mono/diheme cytochrome c family protein